MPKLDTSALVRRTSLLPRFLKDEPAQHLLKVASSADVKAALKRISPVALPGMSFPIRKGQAYLFVVSLGSSEFFNCNENADYNMEADGKVVTFPEPCDPEITTMVLGKGLKNTHGTFKQYGAVYRNHKTEPEHNVPRSGEIVWERYNDRMHRGELIVELPEDKWAKELTLHEQGIPLMWSQGNGVPMDVCSRCGFMFKPKMKEEQRCKHIRLYKLMIGEDGFQNMLYCPDCLFYDISYVGNNPASKIAAALLRVAGSEDTNFRGSFGIRRINHYSAGEVTRAMLNAENEISPEEVAGIRTCCAPEPDVDANFIKEARDTDSDKLIAALHRLAIVLTPTQFHRIFAPSDGEPVGVSGFLDALPGAVGRAVEQDPEFQEDTGYCPQEPPDPTVIRGFEKYVPDLGSRPMVARRILIIRTASSQNLTHPHATPSGLRLADEYVRYLHTCLSSFAGPHAARRYIGIALAGV